MFTDETLALVYNYRLSHGGVADWLAPRDPFDQACTVQIGHAWLGDGRRRCCDEAASESLSVV